jgi:hypothetical protein
VIGLLLEMGEYCSNNKLAEQSAKISKLEHNATEQGWAAKSNMNALYNKMSGLEIRMESQEQYSRRKSLKLHNIQVLVDVMIIQ